MLRRIFSLLLLLMMMRPDALAEDTPIYQVSTFSGRLPEELLESLAALVPDESNILSGASIRYNGYHVSSEDAPAYRDCLSALILVDTGDSLCLWAAAQPEGQPWQVSDYTRFLRQGKNISVGIYQPTVSRIPVFSVDYGVQGGTMSDLIQFHYHQLWGMSGHINTATKTTITVLTDEFALADSVGYQHYACARVFWLEYMQSMDEFPTSRAALESMEHAATAARQANAAAGLAYAQGAHLRTKPTAKSASLGQYNPNVPVILTGEEAAGTSYPWMKIRIGSTEGWMSSNYLYDAYTQLEPVPLGRTVECCPLYDDPSAKEAVIELPAGATFHILTEYKGMYHICIPQGEISCAVDVDGVYGYIPKEGVLTSATPTALDALENR